MIAPERADPAPACLACASRSVSHETPGSAGAGPAVDPTVTRIVVLSDTHIPAARAAVPPATLARIEGADLILRAGDICCAQVLERLQPVAPLAAVYGNVDPPDLQSALPSARIVECDGIRIGLTHGHYGHKSTTPDRAMEIFAGVQDLQVIVFGRSHIPLLETRQGIVLFNPGSAMQPRTQSLPSIGLIDVQDGRAAATHVFLG